MSLWKMEKKRQIYNTFILLVRAGIGTGTANDSWLAACGSDSTDWNALKALADAQGLSAIVLDGLNEVRSKREDVRSDWFPDQTMTLQWVGEVWRDYERRYDSYKKAISELAGFYNAHGYKMMVLKGYGCSLNWPKPEHRPCGDIDIWLFGKQKEADEILAKEKGIKIDNSHHHHTVFQWGGFDVENHYSFVNVYAHKSSAELDNVFKELADIRYIKSLESIETSSSKTNGFIIANMMLGDEKVHIPSSNLHALFLIRHMASHFASSEISLRQVLDWAFFVEKQGAEIDWKWLMGLLEKYHMKDFFNCINAICVGDLGLDVKSFPVVRFDPNLKDKVLKDILEPAYGAAEPGMLIPRLFYKFKRWHGNAWKQELCFSESRWSIFWSSVWSHLLKPKSI